MTAGFESYRSDGKLQVSSTYPVYQFIKKIQGVGNFFDTSGQQYSDHVLVVFSDVTNNTYTSTYRFTKGAVNGWATTTAPPSNATLSLYSTSLTDAYVFDISNVVSSSNYGLQIFDETGRKTFDSSIPTMRIIDFIQIGVSSANYNWTVIKNGLNYGGNKNTFTKTYSNFNKIGVLPLKDTMWDEREAWDQYFCATWHKAYGNTYQVEEYDDEYGISNSGQSYAESMEFMALIVSLDHLE